MADEVLHCIHDNDLITIPTGDDNMNVSFRNFRKLVGVALFSAATTLAAQSQSYPTRRVSIIVPYPAGSTTDIIARLIAAPLALRLGQAVVVENRAGAGGAIGVRVLKQSPADGHTIGLIVSANVIQPHLQKAEMPFDVRTDFVPLSMMYSGLYMLNVAPSFPAKTVAEFVSYAKANPQKIFYGSSGAGTTTHLAGELLKQLAGIEMTHVPFKGSPEIYTAMGSGDIQASFDLWGTSRPMIESGRVRGLGVTSKTRNAALPQFPAIAETVPGYEVLVWTGFAAPLGTPPAAVNRLVTELRAVMAQPDLKARVAGMGVDIGGNSPTEFAQFVRDDFEKWDKAIKMSGLSPQ
jgi:tripartite-type tricarboxylate transporter receptor subunit TctC